MITLRRTTYLINRPFQVKMLVLSFMVTGPMISLFYYTYIYFINSLLTKLEFIDVDMAASFAGYLTELNHNMRLILVSGTIILVLFNSLFFVLLSHSIVGPIEKLKTHLAKKIKGEATGALSFRSTDFFVELPELVNTAFGDKVE